MSGIEAAFFGALGRDAESKISKGGKNYLRLNVRVGDGDAGQWISVMVFDQAAVQIAAQLVKGVRLYVEGTVKLDSWRATEGTERHGLSCMSWHCRVAQIGRNRPPKREKPTPAASGPERAERSDYRPSGASPFNDDIPFAPE
jgi:single-stranded DNA-binding protein